MDKKYDIFQVVKEIEEHGEAGRAVLFLLLEIFTREKNLVKKCAKYRAALDAIRKINRNRKKSAQEAIDALCDWEEDESNGKE